MACCVVSHALMTNFHKYAGTCDQNKRPNGPGLIDVMPKTLLAAGAHVQTLPCQT
jgi:hypothetical protein